MSVVSTHWSWWLELSLWPHLDQSSVTCWTQTGVTQSDDAAESELSAQIHQNQNTSLCLCSSCFVRGTEVSCSSACDCLLGGGSGGGGGGVPVMWGGLQRERRGWNPSDRWHQTPRSWLSSTPVLCSHRFFVPSWFSAAVSAADVCSARLRLLFFFIAVF